MRMLQRDNKKVLLTGRLGTQTLEVRLVKELLTIHQLTNILMEELLLEVTMLV